MQLAVIEFARNCLNLKGKSEIFYKPLSEKHSYYLKNFSATGELLNSFLYLQMLIPQNLSQMPMFLW